MRLILLCLGVLASLAPEVALADDVEALVYPSSDVELDVRLLSETMDQSAWSNLMLGSTYTSDQAIGVWCSVISSETPALAVSTAPMGFSNSSDCPNREGNTVLEIELPSSLLGDNRSFSWADGSESAIDQSVYLYLRGGTEGLGELSAIGKGVLAPLYGATAPELFQAGRQGGNEDTFFPNFCQMCGCCTEKQY